MLSCELPDIFKNIFSCVILCLASDEWKQSQSWSLSISDADAVT